MTNSYDGMQKKHFDSIISEGWGGEAVTKNDMIKSNEHSVFWGLCQFNPKFPEGLVLSYTDLPMV